MITDVKKIVITSIPYQVKQSRNDSQNGRNLLMRKKLKELLISEMNQTEMDCVLSMT